MRKQFVIATLAALLVSPSLVLADEQEQEKDVDMADSLNFGKFHSNKGDSVKLYDSKTGAVLGSKPAAVVPPAAAVAPERQGNEAFTVKVRYSLASSAETRFSAFSAITDLHQQMAQHCPQGWEKLSEWSEPVAGDFILHYGFRCLK